MNPDDIKQEILDLEKEQEAYNKLTNEKLSSLRAGLKEAGKEQARDEFWVQLKALATSDHKLAIKDAFQSSYWADKNLYRLTIHTDKNIHISGETSSAPGGRVLLEIFIRQGSYEAILIKRTKTTATLQEAFDFTPTLVTKALQDLAKKEFKERKEKGKI